MRDVVISLTIALVIATSNAAAAVVAGQIDTFQSGTTENWVAGGGPMVQFPPVPPHVLLSGGPGGSNDAFLVLTASGGAGSGSRLTAFNILSQWADDYLTNGVSAISLDLKNLGPTSLTIRLEFENPFAGGDFAVTNTGITLPSGADWIHATFPIGISELTALQGTAAGALANTTVLRIIHAPGLTAAEPVVGVLGVDNIAAAGNIAAVPEPATIYIAAVGVLLMTGLLGQRVGRGRPQAPAT